MCPEKFSRTQWAILAGPSTLDTDEFYDLEEDPFEVHNRIYDSKLMLVRNRLHDMLLEHMNRTRDCFRGYQWACRPWREDKHAEWENDGFTRQRENEEYEPRQLDYDTGLPMESAVRYKIDTTKKVRDKEYIRELCGAVQTLLQEVQDWDERHAVAQKVVRQLK